MIDSLPGENWLPVPGYEGLYSVSDHGRVYSHVRHVDTGAVGRTRVGGRLLKPYLAGHRDPVHRYLTVNLTDNGKRRKCIRVHRLLLLAFVGPCPDGMEGLHWDDDKFNNHLSNLRYGTRADNGRDRSRNCAERTHCKWNHEWTAANTYFDKNGTRICRECARTSRRKFRKERREAVA